jgi:hypothetical protein
MLQWRVWKTSAGVMISLLLLIIRPTLLVVEPSKIG